MVDFTRLVSQSQRPAEAIHVLGIELEEIDGFGNVCIGFPPWLTRFKDFPRRQFKAPLSHGRSGFPENPHAIRRGKGTPFLIFAESRFNGFGNIGWLTCLKASYDL
jgi:hypothetical protein